MVLLSVLSMMRMHTRLLAGASLLVLLSIAMVIASAAPSTAATSGVVIDANILSATNLNATGCEPGMAGVTDLGRVQPGVPSISSDDCALTWGSSNDTAKLRVFQADGYVSAMAGYTRADALDPSFNSGAILTIGADRGRAFGADIGRDGSTYVVGNAEAGSTVWVAKVLPNGALDPTYGASDGDGLNGLSTLDLRAGVTEHGYAIAVLGDGRAIITGDFGSSPTNAYLARLTATGELDTTFATAGVQEITVMPQDDLLAQVLVQPDGAIVAAGYGHNGSWRRPMVVKTLADGTLDSSFASDGIWNDSGMSSDAAPDTGDALALQPDGKIVIGGWSQVGAAEQAFIMRLNPNGTLDTSYGYDHGAPVGPDGWATFDFGVGNDGFRHIELDTKGRIIAAGYAGPDTVVARFTSSGVYDTTFNASGQCAAGDLPGYCRPSIDSSGNDLATTMNLQSDGAIVVAGVKSSGGGDNFAARLNPDGALDKLFNTTGVRSDPYSPTDKDQAEFISASVDGSIVIVGFRIQGLTSDDDPFVLRYQGIPIDNYSDAGNKDWGTTGAGHFGLCLETVGGTAVASAPWTAAGNNNCTNVDGTFWQGIAAKSGDLTAQVATIPAATTTATTTLRFGFRPLSSQKPGGYAAPIIFEVVAP